MYNEDFGENEGEVSANWASVPDEMKTGAACPRSTVTAPA
jgi:hypothetical protein